MFRYYKILKGQLCSLNTAGFVEALDGKNFLTAVRTEMEIKEYKKLITYPLKKDAK